jgi:serralysin
MATRVSSVSGNWYSTIWYDPDTNVDAVGPPGIGDDAFLVAQAATITASNVSTHGTLDGINLSFAWNHVILPVLDVTNETFGSAMSITNNVDGGGGQLILRGTTANAGRIQSLNNTVGGGMTLDIRTFAGAQRFTNSGTIGATNGSSVLVTGGTLANTGVLTAGTLDGSYSTGSVTITSALVNSGTVTVQLGSSLVAFGGVTNTGTIANLNGTVVLGGAIVNDGTILDTSGALTLSGPVTGSGTIHIGSTGTLSVAGSVANTQTLRFDTGLGTIRLTDAAHFHGQVQALTGRDVIDLVGIAADATSYDAGTGLLTVTNGGATVAQFTLVGGSALTTVTDNAGGTILTTKLAGTQAQLTSAIVNGVPGGLAHNWIAQVGISPVVTYSFDPTSNWTTAEQAAFVKGLGFWAGIANISFLAATGIGGIVFTRGNSGGAFTATQLTGTGQVTAAVVSIDTSVAGFADITASGVADIAAVGNFGGNAWMTVLHEIGHAIGLSHPGNYDSTADLATQQVYYLDSAQYTLMSYFNGATTGADWVATGYSGTALHPQTPMLDDIAALQQIYGANTTTLAGNHVFGFNSSFAAGSVWDAYNFAVNAVPVVTLSDGGGNDTLDLSGYGVAMTIDLRQGGFSSVAGLTDNLAIALGTVIDTAIGGSGDDRFVLNGDGDTIDGGAGNNVAVFSGTRAQYSLTNLSGTIFASAGAVQSALTRVQTLVFSDQTVAASSIADVACFARGTRIRTERGDIAVEDLRSVDDGDDADWAITGSGHASRIAWIGWRRVALRGHARPWDINPVRVRAGAISTGLPARDLILSPDHALYLDGVLVPVRYLINGATIVQEDHWRAVDYFHVELDSHDVLLAEALPVESYLDTGNRSAFLGSGAVQVHADIAALSVWDQRACASLVTSGPMLEAIRGGLIARAEQIGWQRVIDQDLQVVADGIPVAPEPGHPTTFRLPPHVASVRLVSRRGAPADTHASSDDRRVLGMPVVRILADGAELKLGGPGWHTAELGWCWTDGDAALSVPPGARLEIEIAFPHHTWTAAPIHALRYGSPQT